MKRRNRQVYREMEKQLDHDAVLMTQAADTIEQQEAELRTLRLELKVIYGENAKLQDVVHRMRETLGS